MSVAHTLEDRWAILGYLQAYQDTVHWVLPPHLLSAFQYLSWFWPKQVRVPDSALGRTSAWVLHPEVQLLSPPRCSQHCQRLTSPSACSWTWLPLEPRTCCSHQLSWSCMPPGVPVAGLGMCSCWKTVHLLWKYRWHMEEDQCFDRQAQRVWDHHFIPSVSWSNCSTDLLLPLSHTAK